MGEVLFAVSFCYIIFGSTVRAEDNQTFPDAFLFGVATSAYQIEGAWDVDGKGENIWDHWIHSDPSHIKNNDTADVACDSYSSYKADVARVAYYLNATHYKFSISWSRILPTGMNDSINLIGLMYYQSLIGEILQYNMIPVATLYHFDLPQPLQDLGGWTNVNMIDYFVQYARVVFQSFPDVQYWITFNDPKSICTLGYGTGVYAPGLAVDGINDYSCAYVVLKSHAAVYHMYKEEFPKLKAKLSMAINIDWSEPASDSEADKNAAERELMFEFGLYAHPIFKGNWPSIVIERVGNRSNHERFEKSRLPELIQGEIDYIHGTADFMAINTYTTNLVSDIDEPEYDDPGYMKDIKANVSQDPNWDVAPNGKSIVPWGLRKSLAWLKSTYDDPQIFITGNGVSDDGSSLEDTDRINFFTEYLTALLDAMYEDNVTVFGYTAWSLLDTFEWTDGYSQHYGFYQVNFSDSRRSRKAKKSVSFYHALASSHRIPDETNPTTTYTTTTEGSANIVVVYPLVIYVVVYICFTLT